MSANKSDTFRDSIDTEALRLLHEILDYTQELGDLRQQHTEEIASVNQCIALLTQEVRSHNCVTECFPVIRSEVTKAITTEIDKRLHVDKEILANWGEWRTGVNTWRNEINRLKWIAYGAGTIVSIAALWFIQNCDKPVMRKLFQALGEQ